MALKSVDGGMLLTFQKLFCCKSAVSEVVGALKMRAFLSGMPECKPGLKV